MLQAEELECYSLGTGKSLTVSGSRNDKVRGKLESMVWCQQLIESRGGENDKERLVIIIGWACLESKIVAEEM